MWTKKLLLILCLCSVCQAAQVIRYVDPDAPGPAHDGTSWNDAYLSLSAWNTAEDTDLDTANNYMTVYCRSSSGTNDTTNFAMSGWITSATDYIEIIGADFPADGIWDDTKYILENATSSGSAITMQEDYVRFVNMQFLNKAPDGSNTIYISSVGTTDIRFDSCIFKADFSAVAATLSSGLRVNDATATVKVYNCVFYGFIEGADADFWAVWADNQSSLTLYNCTIYGNYAGIDQDVGTCAAYNCAVGNNTDDFVDTITIDYCCSDGGEGTNAQTPSGGAWANEFTAPGSDFSLLVGGNCVGNGTDNPGAGLYSDDIIGTARTTTWDIGAFEYATPAPPAAGGQLIMIQEF